jgi:hypothetical protein
MKKMFDEKNGRESTNRKNSRNNFFTTLFRQELLLSAFDNFGVAILKSLYLIFGIAGLTGTIIIIFKVIGMDSVSSLEMILIFITACLPLGVMGAGFYGLSRITQKSGSGKYEKLTSINNKAA